MKNKLIFWCTLIVLTGCLFSESCKPREKTPVIGLLMDKFNVERWAKDTTFFIKAVQKMNGKVICMVADGNADKQLEQAKKLIAEDVDVLVVVPADTKKAAEIANAAISASKRVISYDRLIQNAFIDYYISFDNVKVGELQANYIMQRLGRGNVALINGPVSDQNSSFLRFGQLGVLQPYIERGEIKIIYDQMVNAWTREEGYRAGMECLKVSHVEAIIAGNDLLAGGVIQALEEKNLAGKVLIAGQDADKEARENIIKGIQAVTIYKSIEDLATNAARIAVDLAMGKPINAGMTTVNNGLQMVPALLLNPTLVNKGNIGLEVEVKPAN